MKEYLLFYVLFKLDDFKMLLNNTYGWTILTVVFLIGAFGWHTRGKDHEDDTLPFFGFRNMDEEKAVFYASKCRSYLRIILIMFLLQLSSNIINTTIPSTGQALAIIVGAEGTQSKTFQALKDLDPALAKYLKTQMIDYLEQK
jgi:hypothetical protein